MAYVLRVVQQPSGARLIESAMEAVPALLVGGMHRSGTSALTRVLSLAGAALPRTLMPPGRDNPKGFWESSAIASVNDQTLRETGSSWDDIFGFDTRPAAAAFRPAAISRICKALEAEFEADCIPVIKDPRLSLLLPIWNVAIHQAGYCGVAIGLVRRPMEVAHSLMKRNGFPIAKSLLLWLGYFLAFERDSRGMPRVFIAYEDLLKDWRQTLARVETATGLVLPGRSVMGDLEIDRFLSKDDRHHEAADSSMRRDDPMGEWLSRTYAWAVKASKDADEPDSADLDDIRAAMSASARVFAPVVYDLSLRLGEAAAGRDTAESSFQNAERAVAELTREREEERALAARKIARLEQDLTDDRAIARSTIDRVETLLASEREKSMQERERMASEIADERATAAAEFDRLREDSRLAQAALADSQSTAIAQRQTLEAAMQESRDRLSGVIRGLEDQLAADRQLAASERQRLLEELGADRAKARAEIERIERERETERESVRDERKRLEAALVEIGAERDRERENLRRAQAREEAEARRAEAVAQTAREQNERLEALRREETEAAVVAVGRLGQDLFPDLQPAPAETRPEGSVSALTAQMREILLQARKARLLMQAERDQETHRADGYADQIAALKTFLMASMPLHRRISRATWRSTGLRPAHDLVAVAAISLRQGWKKAAQTLHMTRVIRKSGAFDPAFYLGCNWDVAALGRDPVLHYVTDGAREMRDPSETFSTRGYLERHPDVARRGDPALYHFITHGRDEGRLPVRPVQQHASPPAAFPAGAPSHAKSSIRTPPDDLAFARRAAAAPQDPYKVRPDDMVAAEAAEGEKFLTRFQLLTDGPDFGGAVSEINRLFRLAPTPPDVPAASIIIPIYGQLPYTLNALHALARHRSRYTFEIIVVDDCSPDASAHWLAEIPAVRLQRQATNGGFILSCNAGAMLARGRHLVMLNNDTRVVSGWLDELVGSFETLPGAGLVGSKLFYADGSLQEAGGIIWEDGSAWNYGRNEDPGHPAYSYARSVDYVSGASIAIPANLWREIGGFDEHYRPAYGEDSDLALKVRYRCGRGVWMQPLSRVIHYEGKTSGTDTSGGVKAYQIANSRKLHERWRDTLLAHRPNGQSPGLERDRGFARRALVLDATTPEPDKDAGSLTCFELMRALQANGYKVSFMAESNLLFLPAASGGLQRIGVEVCYAPFVPSIESWLQENGRDVDVVLLFRKSVAERVLADVRKYCPNAAVVFHSSDLHFLREEREADLTGDPALQARARDTRQAELALVRTADVTIVHSTYEETVLEQAAPDANVAVFPWILDPKGRAAPFADRRDITFLGGYRHSPNADAVRYFVSEIWPLIRVRNPEIRFIIAGSEMPDDLAALDEQANIVAKGYVEDLKSFFESVRLSVAPIRYGAGIKGKVAMSLAHGVPTVLTECAAEGMGLIQGESCLVHDDPQAFADAVVELYADESRWTRMSEAALAFVERTYGSALGRQRMADIIASAGRTGRDRTGR